MTAPNAAPALGQVAPDPGDDLATQPSDVDAGIIAAGVLALSVGGAADVDDVDEGVGVAQVVEELVAQTLALVGAGNEAGDVEQLDGDAALAVDAGAVVGAAAIRDAVACAGTVDLEIAYRALRVDGGESASVTGRSARTVRSREERRGSAQVFLWKCRGGGIGKGCIREISWRGQSARGILD